MGKLIEDASVNRLFAKEYSRTSFDPEKAKDMKESVKSNKEKAVRNKQMFKDGVMSPEMDETLVKLMQARSNGLNEWECAVEVGLTVGRMRYVIKKGKEVHGCTTTFHLMAKFFKEGKIEFGFFDADIE